MIISVYIVSYVLKFVPMARRQRDRTDDDDKNDSAKEEEEEDEDGRVGNTRARVYAHTRVCVQRACTQTYTRARARTHTHPDTGTNGGKPCDTNGRTVTDGGLCDWPRRRRSISLVLCPFIVFTFYSFWLVTRKCRFFCFRFRFDFCCILLFRRAGSCFK